MDSLKKMMIIFCSVLVTGHAYAESVIVEFSAEAVVSMPQQADKKTKLFVSEKAVRSEITSNGYNIVEIVYPEEGRTILINDSLKSYKEKTVAIQKKKENNNPCDQIINAICEKLGTENINGNNTEKWQIISDKNGRKIRSLHWIDVNRKLALREFFPDGSVAELKMMNKEKINGRNTEKWSRTLSRPNGQNTTSYQWYDTGLKIAIKEELPGGYVRELKNIKISRQSDELFIVPAGYTKIEFQPVNYPEYMGR